MKKLLIIIILIAIGVGGYFYLTEEAVTPTLNDLVDEVMEKEPVACCRAMTAECLACTERVSVDEYCVNNPNTVGCEDEEEAIEEDIFAGSPTIELKDVTDGNASGEGWIVVKEGKTYHKVIAVNMPELENKDFYEGWLVKSPAFFSTGKMSFDEDEQVWILEYETDGDKSDYSKIVITLEPNDGDPAPATHIIEN